MIEDSTPPDDAQRREDVRICASLPVELSARVISLTQFKDRGHEASVLSCMTTSISGGGFSILHSEATRLGTSFNVSLWLPDEPRPLIMKAKVVRCDPVEGSEVPLFELGLMFTRIAEAVRSRVVGYIFDAQRIALMGRTHK